MKQVRQFEEVAGEAVIFVHRLLKNHVQGREYVLLSEAARAATGLEPALLREHMEDLEGVGPARLWLCDAQAIPFELPAAAPAASTPSPSPSGLGGKLRSWLGLH
jgi:hypothetical protein